MSRKQQESSVTPAMKLAQIRTELRATYCERESEIDGLLVAILAMEHVLLLGPPGTAKSALSRSVCSAVDGASWFQWLLTKFTTPEEVFGPISLKGLENDVVRRITTHKLPEAHLGFLDEIFKANSAILNSLLTIINERQFHNNGSPLHCPLVSVVGASNELPEADDLGALFDRFLLCYWVSPISDRDNLRSLLVSSREPTITASLTLSELADLQRQVETVGVTADAVDAILQIKSDLEAIGIRCSDRRWRKAMKIVRAFALLQGHAEVEEDDLLILEHCLWREPDQRPRVREKVGSVASPLTSEALAILDAAKEAHAALLKTEGTADFLVQSVEIRATLKEMRNRLEASIKTSGGKARRAEKVLEQLSNLQADIKRRADRALD